ncbi:MAG: LamG-like jellyroll fold domain-containing protein [Verrucomicrobiota bacterium]
MDSEHIEAYLADELSDAGREQVERALENDLELRASFLHQLRIHSALGVLRGGSETDTDSPFDASVMAHLESEGAGSERGFAKSVLTEIVEEREGIRPLRWPDLIKAGVISAAASIALMVFLQNIIFNANAPLTASRAWVLDAPNFVARVESSDSLSWSETTQERVREDGWLTPGLLEIESGQTTIAFNSGATATVEGPAVLSIESLNRLFLKSGRITADVPPPATGFTINTPRMNVVDIGTRFGVSVEKNGDSELHVMEGLVEASRNRGNSVTTLVREGIAVRADSRTRSQLAPIPYKGENFVLTSGHSPMPEPALRFTFNESAGGMIEDSGNRRQFDVSLIPTGELDQSPKRAPGFEGTGLLFGRGQSLEVPLSKEFRLEDDYTLGFWLKIPPRIGQKNEAEIVRYGREGLGWSLTCLLNRNDQAKGALCLKLGDDYLVGTTDLADGNWHHIACRFIGGEEARMSSHFHLFIDGKLETLSASKPYIPAESGRVGQLLIGGETEAAGFEGWIDEFHIFREAVTTSTVLDLSH